MDKINAFCAGIRDWLVEHPKTACFIVGFIVGAILL